MDRKRFSANIFLLAALFYLSVYTSWYLAYSNDFFYPFIYYINNIDRHVASAPLPDKSDSFSKTATAEHLRLFHDMLVSVEKGGGQLGSLRYHTDAGSYAFLKPAELAQMQDVAATIGFYKSLARVFLLLSAAICVYMAAADVEAYRWNAFTRGMSVVFIVVVLVVKLIGLRNIIGFFGGLVFGGRGDWFFNNPLSLPALIMPYPSTFVCFFSIMAVAALAVWAVYYKLCGKLIDLLSSVFWNHA